ncbi:hypothetical protein EBQ24_08025 [Allofranklinella schreckenbergeri]|uniref:Uncharacterized protein n=1 Tax=Allofranklinella schreckenbergeri TaxID=1076744 RepID=A0A3M6R149_9BURK|nr:hypothetical protein [Allofranklinella schreckenbergeri]RMX08978.1 hypothetical protein EBQ24_08025 [Allofranklinella schreckenbergeri]
MHSFDQKHRRNTEAFGRASQSLRNEGGKSGCALVEKRAGNFPSFCIDNPALLRFFRAPSA